MLSVLSGLLHIVATLEGRQLRTLLVIPAHGKHPKQANSDTFSVGYRFSDGALQMDRIPFLVVVPEEASAQEVKGFLSEDEGRIAVREIPIAQLRQNLGKISHAFMEALADIKAVGGFELAEVEILVEISAEGGVQFIGSSKIGGKGAITLKFKQPA